MRTLLAASSMLMLAASAHAALQAIPLVTGLSQPQYVTGAPGDTTHLYILEHGSGTSANIKVYNKTTGITSTFLTVNGVATGDEQGLLGLAFDPDYATNKKFYLSYVAQGGASGISRVAQYQATSATVANPTPLGTLLELNQPQANHNGGWIGFSNRPGDSRNLYIAFGDGGNSYDQGSGHTEPTGNAQSLNTLLGKMLRVAISSSSASYTIPGNNPFAASSDPNVRKEIFTYGLRNPYRASFDRATGDLFIGDVGQSAREEIDVQKASNPSGGENYGWRLREGDIATPGGTPAVGGAAPAGAIDPILDYARTSGITEIAGRTVIGGYVYRGSLLGPEYVGDYFFADYLGVSGGRTELFSLNYNGTSISNLTDLTSQLNPGASPLIGNISSLGEDTAGELYIADITKGIVFQIVPEPTSLALLACAMPLLLRRRP